MLAILASAFAFDVVYDDIFGHVILESSVRKVSPPVNRQLDYAALTAELDNALKWLDDNTSIFYKNMESGFVYTHNPNRVYFAASVPKAFLALWIYQMAEMDKADLDSLIAYTSEDYFGGSGIIRHRYELGQTFTVRELLRLNLSESDNIATNMLSRVFGLDGYRDFIRDMNGNVGFVGNMVVNSRLTVNEAAIFAIEIYNYINSNGRYSKEFEMALLNNQFPFIVSHYPVLSKTGWTSPWAWHDMAIVKAPSPYILIILSARDGWQDTDFAEFYKISMLFQDFNTNINQV